MKIFLFKATQDESDNKPDKFETCLKSANFSPQIIPVIAFDFCNLDSLLQKLQSPDNYEGIIFTSPRCVQSVDNTLSQNNYNNDNNNFLNVWTHQKFIFCVGPATFEAAKNLFKNSSKIITGVDGNTESLGLKIIEILTKNTNLPLLYPCGNLKRDTLQNILLEKDIKTDSIIVYETVENPFLKSILSEKAEDMKISKEVSPFVFFSPSGINFSLKYLKHSLLIGDNNNKRLLIALGPTTKEALLKVPGVDLTNVFQCKSPTCDSLLEILATFVTK